jgi:hypothetical protein
MRSWTIPLAIASCAVGAGAARADQCAWIDGATAARASAALAHHPKVVSFCEPCGDPAPGEPARVGRVEVRAAEGGASEVFVDGRGLDLAYTYVQTSPHQYRNLAALAACPATGVSPTLRIDPATASGVMIRADDVVPDDPPAPPAAVAVTAPPLPAPAPAAIAPPAPIVVVVSTPSSEPTALLLLLLGLGAAFAGGTLWVVRGLARRRRRPDFTPRAAGLVDHRRRPPAA